MSPFKEFLMTLWFGITLWVYGVYGPIILDYLSPEILGAWIFIYIWLWSSPPR